LPASFRGPMVALLLEHVAEVVALGAQKQVRRSYAKRLVADMTHTLAGRDRTVRVEPRQTVCAPQFPVVPLLSITVRTARRRPDPAFAGFADVLPEPARYTKHYVWNIPHIGVRMNLTEGRT
jgi:hypothetical protein